MLQQVIYRLGAHLCYELVRVAFLEILVVIRQAVHYREILVLGQQVHLVRPVYLNILNIFPSLDDAWLYHDVFLVVDHRVEFLGGYSEQIAYLVRQAAEIPYMCYRHDELDVSASLAAHLLLRDLNAAPVAYYALVAYAFVLSAGTLVVLRWAEDALAEKSVALGLVGTVVYGLRLGDLAVTVFEDFLRRSEADGNLREIVLYL